MWLSFRPCVRSPGSVGISNVKRPEIEAWDFAQHARLLAAAKAEGDDWYVAVCLAGGGGLRVGEVKALRWRGRGHDRQDDPVKQRTYNGVTTTPKWRTRRTVPMTSMLYDALKRMSTICGGVVRNLDGSQKSDGGNHALAGICRRAGCRYWPTLRHSVGITPRCSP